MNGNIHKETTEHLETRLHQTPKNELHRVSKLCENQDSVHSIIFRNCKGESFHHEIIGDQQNSQKIAVRMQCSLRVILSFYGM